MLSSLLLLSSFSALVLSVPITSAPACTPAQAEATHQCLNVYFAHFGPPTPFTSNNFFAVFEQFLEEKGKAGFADVCSWHNAIAPCAVAVGADVSQCFTNDNFAAWYGTNMSDTISFRTFHFESDYECNQGYQVGYDNFDCLLQVSQYNSNELNSCLSIYMGKLNHGDDVCKAYNNYMKCSEEVYTAVCGPQVQSWLCNMEEIGMKVNYQGCNSALPKCNNLNVKKIGSARSFHPNLPVFTKL